MHEERILIGVGGEVSQHLIKTNWQDEGLVDEMEEESEEEEKDFSTFVTDEECEYERR